MRLKSLLFFAAAPLGLIHAAAASARAAEPVPALAPASAPASPAASQADPEPLVFPGWGFNPADLDPATRPGNDFNGYVNGKWLAATEIPAQYVSYGVARNLTLTAERQIRTIVGELAAGTHPAGTLAQQVGDSYRAFVDTAAIDAAGMAPAQPYLQRIFAVKDEAGLAELFAAPGFPSPIDVGVSNDPTDPGRNTLFVGTGGYGLPDRDNYLVDTPRNLEMRGKYKDYLTFILGKAGYADPATSAGVVYELERKMAQIDWDRTLSRNPELTTNPVDRAGLLAMTGNFPLERFLTASQLAGQQNFIVSNLLPDAAKIARLGLKPADLAKLGGGVPALLQLIDREPLANWQAWMAAHFISGNAGVLPSDLDAASFAFYGKFLQGRTVQRDRWRRGLANVQGQMGEAIGQIYVERYFPATSKAAMVDLVANLRRALALNINDLTWMSPATKAKALVKLDATTVKIGYPDKFKTYETLVIKPGAALDNQIAAATWGWADDLHDLANPVDKAKWLMTPQTVNAYNMPTANEIVFPAAYLQAPNFSPTADLAVNYGGIGATIGHEIGHGFDDNGSHYDGRGQLANWWTPADRRAFDALGSRLAGQYDRFCPLDGGKTCLNGKLTLGENLADLGGLSMAYRAYHLALGNTPAPVIDGLTGDQRFFIAYAQTFRDKAREAFVRQTMETDPHSPEAARINEVVRNFGPWYAAFGVKPGDALYLPPAQRVRVW